ncbi:phasin family protein [Methylovirgula sp. 4M-Z18]|uniref:phasin family protein n=1 Tax=Methylovirgula sp. 4M-Z18 TaxID=2293567 RepID=UPI000E2FC82B|nr:phasin family protein [Methylovirgula sp. 4M-Z18]RFB81525.1 phasin family protein [Methylovirgula sp. 4M-Z18]
MFTSIEDFQKFSKDNVANTQAAVTTFAKGFQQIAAETTEYSKKSIEAGSAAFEKLLGAKTLESAIQIQQDYAKTAYEGFVAQATKIGELYQGLVKDAFKPVEAAVAKASGK